MSTPATPYDTISEAVTGVDGDLLKVGGIGLGVGVTLFIVKKGWSLFRRFAN